jgi:hypothetical protein
MTNRNLIICCAATALLFSTFGNLHAQWQTSGSNIYYNNGNVGIGTANPTTKLTVAGYIKSARIIASESDPDIGGAVVLINEQKTLPGQAKDWAIYNMSGTYGNSLQFWAYDYIGCTSGLCHSRLTIMDTGNVGIGTASPTSKLTVAGDIRAREIMVDANAGADFVFAPDYRLRPLDEVETFIKDNRRLPDVAPADSMVQNGVNMGEMQIKLLQKIEELTLYVIELKKENEAQQKAYRELKKEIDNIKNDE